MMFSISLECIRVKEEVRTDAITVMTIIDLAIDHLVEIEVHLIEVGQVLAEIIDQITEVDCKKILEMTTDRTIREMTTDEIIIEIITGKTIDELIIENKGIEIGVEVEAGIVTEITTEIVQERTLSKVGILVEIGVGKDNHDHNLQEKKTEEIVID